MQLPIKHTTFPIKHTTFPNAGGKLIFNGVPSVYYPMFLNMKTEAEQFLVLGQEYTVSKVEIYSSWCAVWLEGVDQKYYFNLGFFKVGN